MSYIAELIEEMDGQVALQSALAEYGVSITQQAISLWKTQGYAPANRHAILAQLVADAPTGPVYHNARRRLAEDIQAAVPSRGR